MAKARSEAEGILTVFRALSDTTLVIENESGVSSTQVSSGIKAYQSGMRLAIDTPMGHTVTVKIRVRMQ